MLETIGSVALAISQSSQSMATTETNKKQPGLDVESNAFAALLMGMLVGTGLPALPDSPVVVPELQSAGLPTAALPMDATLLINEQSMVDMDNGLDEQTDEGVEVFADQTSLDPAPIIKSVSGDPPSTVSVTEARFELQQRPDDNQPVPLIKDSPAFSDRISQYNVEPPLEKERSPGEKEEHDTNRILLAEVGVAGDSNKSLPGELKFYQESKASKIQPTTDTSSILTSEYQAATTRFSSAENEVSREGGLSVDEAARLFRQVFLQAGRQKGSGRQEITLKLDPPHLGRIHLTLQHRAGAISARFAVENDMAQGTLQASMVELKDSLGELGIQVEDFSVFIGLGQGDVGTNQFEGRQQGGMLPDQKHTLASAHTIGVTFDDQTGGHMLAQSGLDLLV